MKNYLLLFFLCGLLGQANAQQDARFSLFNYNYAILNPAAVGSKEKLSLVALHRQQWTGFSSGAPYTSTISLDMPIFKLRSAVGMYIISDNHGILQHHLLGISYAVIAHTSDYGKLSLGFNLGTHQNRVNFNAIRTDPNNAYLATDPNFNYGQNQTTYAASTGMGIYYYDRFFKLGISLPILNAFDYYSLANRGQKTKHLFVTTGVNLILNDKINYNPRVLFKLTAGAPLQAEIYNQFVFNQKCTGGFTIRTGESVAAIVSYTFHPQFNMSYAYDVVAFNQLRGTQFGSHEVGLNYVFQFPKYNEQMKVLRIARKHRCIDFDKPDKKKFFKEVEDIFYDRN